MRQKIHVRLALSSTLFSSLLPALFFSFFSFFLFFLSLNLSILYPNFPDLYCITIP